jgi:hypothetical protein
MFNSSGADSELSDQSDTLVLKQLSLQDQSKRSILRHLQAIEFGRMLLEDKTIFKPKKARSEEDLFQGLRIIQRKNCSYRPTKKRRQSSSILKMRRCSSFQLEELDAEPEILKLQSEADIRSFPEMKTAESSEIDISDFYMKVPIQNPKPTLIV